MNIKIRKNEFLSALEVVSKALRSAPTIYSLKGIILETTGDGLTLIASDGTLSIKEEIVGRSLKILKPGKILVSGHLFINIIKKQGEHIEIIEKEELIKINSSELKTTLNTLDVNEYPKINFDVIGKECFVDVKELKKLINNVSYATAEQDRRQILKGVNLIANDSKITAYATNSFRVAKDEMNLLNDIDFNITILSNNLKDFIPQAAEGEIKLVVNDSKILTSYKNTIVLSNLLDGVYPQIEKLFPQEFKNILRIDSNILSKLLDKVSVVQDEYNKTILLTIKEKTLILESKRKEVGQMIIETKDFDFRSSEKEFSIVIDGSFIKQSLTKVSGKILIEFNGPFEAFIIREIGNEKTKSLILPQRSY